MSPDPSTRSGISAVLPGLALAVLVALMARLIHQALPQPVARSLGEVLFAVGLGLLVGNLVRLPERLLPGIRFSFHTLLRAAIVLLGASFAFQQVLAIGVKALVVIVVLMLLALGAALLLGRLAGVPARLATLIGVGTAVCGNSAIAATAPVIHAQDEEVSFAIATNTFFGTLAVLLYPLIGRAFHFPDDVFGTWAGTAVNDTSQVVATGFAFSEPAGRVATAVKLTRNALLGAVVVGVGLAYSRTAGGEPGGEASGRPVSLAARLKQSIPLFVLGFLGMALLNSLGVLRWISARLGTDVTAALLDASRVMILIALAGVGLATRFDAMRRTGLKPLLVGFAAAAITSSASLLLIHLLGPAAE